jgi:hypothetical protein
MAVTDQYVVQFLLQATQASEDAIPWQMTESGGYWAEVNSVRLALSHSYTKGWSGLCLSFVRGADAAYIEEPRPSSIFGRSYRSEEERRLAETLHELGSAICIQCHARQVNAWQSREQTRETLYHLVLFGEP